MVRSVTVQVTEGTLSKAAIKSQLPAASKSALLRFALLRTVMSDDDARAAVFGNPDEITETNGSVVAKIPDHEIAKIEAEYPGKGISEIARAGFAIACGERESKAWESAKMPKGPKPKDSVSS